MPKRKPEILHYASAPQPWYAQADFYRLLFWPITIVLFVAIVLIEAGVGWASAVLQLLTSGLLLLAWLLAGYGWGAIVRSLAKIEDRSPLVRVTTLAAGLGIMSLLVLGLGLLGWMNQPVAHMMLMIGAGVSLYRIVRSRGTIHARVDFVHWWWMLLIPLASLTLTAAMLPAGILWGGDEPNGYDVVEYHLQVPREWFEAGKIIPLHHNVFSFFPFNVEMHYLLAMHTMGGPWVAQFLAQMMHAAFIGLTIAAVYAAVCERGKLPAIMAALFAASAPWMPMLGAIAYNEGGLLLYGTLAIAWAMRSLNVGPALAAVSSNPSTKADPTRCSLVIAGVMAGLACGCKLTAVPILLIGLPMAMGVVMRKYFASLALFILVGVLVFSPWLIRNYAWAGNPVFPEQQTLLGRAHFSKLQSDRFYKAHKARPDQQAMAVRVTELWRQVYADWRFGYGLLPIGVIAMLVTVRQRRSQLLILMLAGSTAFWLIETHLQGRFYVLAIPIAAIGLGYASERRPGLMYGVVCYGVIFLAMGSAFFGLAAVQHRLREVGTRFEDGRQGSSLQELIGMTRFDQSEDIVGQMDDGSWPIVLVGDAKAFFYQRTMTLLSYRTAFDIDSSDSADAVRAWTSGFPVGQKVYLWIDPWEVDRLHRTYGTPALPRWAAGGLGGLPFTIPPASTSPPVPPSTSRPTPASAPSR